MLSFQKIKSSAIFLLFIGAMFCTQIVFAQRDFDPEIDKSFKERVYFGGNFGLQFGTITAVEVSPLVGYMLTPRLSTGAGITYQYFEDKRYRPSYSSSIYGGRVFGRYNILEAFYAYAEYESLNLEFYDPFRDRFSTEWVPGLLIGGGYNQIGAGGRGGFNIMALYNVTYDNVRSPYASPLVLRVGFIY